MLVSLWCVRMIGLTGILGRVYHIGVKFGVARFDIDGQYSGALDSEAGNGWASRSLFVCVIFFFLNFDAGVPSYKYIHYDEESIVYACNAYMHLCKL